jgi:hypothetical protein
VSLRLQNLTEAPLIVPNHSPDRSATVPASITAVGSEGDTTAERALRFGGPQVRKRFLHLWWALLWIALWAPPDAVSVTELEKLPPDAYVHPYRERITVLIKKRYPQLLVGNLLGTPVLTVLFNATGTIARSDLQITAQRSGALTATETQFERLGLRSGELQYVGVAHVQLPGGTALVVFGERTSEDLDRRLVEHYFPNVMTQRVNAGDSLWILFDHSGHVLEIGEEGLRPIDVKKTLERRYRGIRIAAMTESPVIARDGHRIEDAARVPLTLHCVWLTTDSATPQP